MKKSAFLLAALAFTSAAAHAQTTPAAQTAPTNDRASTTRSPEQQAQNQAQRLAKELNLSTEQQTQVQQLMTAQRQETQTAIQNAGGDRRAMGQAMRASRDKLDGQLKLLLTPDQYTKYQQIITQRREQMQERRQAGSTGNGDIN